MYRTSTTTASSCCSTPRRISSCSARASTPRCKTSKRGFKAKEGESESAYEASQAQTENRQRRDEAHDRLQLLLRVGRATLQGDRLRRQLPAAQSGHARD